MPKNMYKKKIQKAQAGYVGVSSSSSQTQQARQPSALGGAGAGVPVDPMMTPSQSGVTSPYERALMELQAMYPNVYGASGANIVQGLNQMAGLA